MFGSLLILTVLITIVISSFYFPNSGVTNAQTMNQSTSDTSSIYVPSTISIESQDRSKNLKPDLATSNLPGPNDFDGWKKIFQDRENARNVNITGLANFYKANVTYERMGNAKVMDIKPYGWSDNDKVLVMTHGGGYTQLSANSTLGGTLKVANKSDLRIISIVYMLAPFSKWNSTTDHIISVIHDLRDNQDIL